MKQCTLLYRRQRGEIRIVRCPDNVPNNELGNWFLFAIILCFPKEGAARNPLIMGRLTRQSETQQTKVTSKETTWARYGDTQLQANSFYDKVCQLTPFRVNLLTVKKSTPGEFPSSSVVVCPIQSNGPSKENSTPEAIIWRTMIIQYP